MTVLQVTNAFTDGDVVSATNFNTNYADIVDYVNARNSGSATWDGMSVSHGTNIPLVANNSTGTQDIVQMKDNGTTVFSINDGGRVNMPYQDFAYASFSGGINLVPAGATVKAEISSISSQTHSSMDSTGKFTCQQAGKYLVIAQPLISGASGDGTTATLYIYKNGAAVSKKVVPAAFPLSSSFNFGISDILSCSASDYIEIYLGRNGSSGALSYGSTFTYYYVAKL